MYPCTIAAVISASSPYPSWIPGSNENRRAMLLFTKGSLGISVTPISPVATALNPHQNAVHIDHVCESGVHLDHAGPRTCFFQGSLCLIGGEILSDQMGCT